MKRLILVFFVVLFSVAAFSDDVARTTGELPVNPLTLFVHGDTHSGLDGTATLHKKITKRIIECNPTLIFNCGDVIHNLEYPQENWQKFDETFGYFVSRYPYYPTIGNHDASELQYYFDYFSNLPLNGNGGRYYYVGHPLAIFIVLDVHDASRPADFNTQLTWLQNVLTTYSGKLYKFVFFHRASHTFGMRGPCIWARDFDPVIQQHGVDIVFMGHTHAYERTVHGGVQYIVTGGAGGVLHDLILPPTAPGLPLPYEYIEETHNYVTVVMAEPFAYVAARYPDGVVFDSFRIYK